MFLVRWLAHRDRCHGIKANKGKKVETANKGLKRLRKGSKGSSSSAANATPARRFGAKAVEPHGLKWFNAQKEADILWRTGLMKFTFHLSSLPFTTLCACWHWDISLLSLRSETLLW
ncbi:hypothetical protein HAX54_052909 [Datura stramonium]|uniref:Uncharacterized protein n=1 Tax=Datura stramonium TaxID=4076 RepID=A0ABS8SZL0_DATST|nr:hypothetical protein [Datura stramonium]